uniref:BEACH domain-containing protein n=1 Tax=Ditylum brightwellii TaxID=49249 RepID=A0A7S1Z0T9_9STRA
MTWIGLAFRRLYGNDSASRKKSGRKVSASFHVRASKQYLPSLLHVAILLDKPIRDYKICLNKSASKSTVKDDSDAVAITPPMVVQSVVMDGATELETTAKAFTDDTPGMSTKKINRTAPEDGEESSQHSQHRQRQRIDSDVDWVSVSSTVDDPKAPSSSSLDQSKQTMTGNMPPSPSLSSIGGSLQDICPSSSSASLNNKSVEEKFQILKDLTSCRNIALHTASMLILNSMTLGGGEASTVVWRTIVSSLAECCSSSSDDGPFHKKSETMTVAGVDSEEKKEPVDGNVGEGNMSSVMNIDDMSESLSVSQSGEAQVEKTPSSETKEKIIPKQIQTTKHSNLTLSTPSNAAHDTAAHQIIFGEDMTHSMLCHLSALILSKIARRNHDSSSGKCLIPLSTNLCSATARLCDMVEEKELLHTPGGIFPSLDLKSKGIGSAADDSANNIILRDKKLSNEQSLDVKSCDIIAQHDIKKYSVDQSRLLCAIVQVMASGRESMGWYQISPTLSLSSLTDNVTERGVLRKEGEGEERKVEFIKPDHKVSVSSTDGTITEATKSLQTKVSQFVEGSLFQNSYELYNQSLSDSQEISYDEHLIKTEQNQATTPPKRSDEGETTPPASKLLLPILQPCLRTVLTSLSFVQSDSLVVPSVEPIPFKKDEGNRQNGCAKQDPMNPLLLREVVIELKLTLKAAIVGLSFPNARDVFLNALASLRRAMSYHHSARDKHAEELCSVLVLAALEDMRSRYVSERKRRDKAVFEAYKDDADKNISIVEMNGPPLAVKSTATSSQIQKDLSEEAERSNTVERLLLGDPVIPSEDSTSSSVIEESSKAVHSMDPTSTGEVGIGDNGLKEQPTGESSDRIDLQLSSSELSRSGNGKTSDDFIMFPQDAMSKENSRVSTMGWSSCKGLGAALEKCYGLVLNTQGKNALSSNNKVSPITTNQQDADLSSLLKNELLSKTAEDALQILRPYLDTWDDSVARDAAESELVELFDENVNLSTPGGNSFERDIQQGKMIMGWESNEQSRSHHSDGKYSGHKYAQSETAADTMSNYIELSSSETSRLLEVRSTFLTSLRFSRVSFVSRYCWRFWMECNGDKTNKLWERCISDGGRDLSGRMATVPMSPQFCRFIPKYLDHSPSTPRLGARTEVSAEAKDEASNIEEPIPVERGVSTGSMDMELAMNNLAKAGHLTIVDITKKEAREDLPAIDASDENNDSADGECGKSEHLQHERKSSDVDDDDDDDDDDDEVGSLGFPEKPLDKSDDMDVDVDAATEVTMQSTTGSTQMSVDESTTSNIGTKLPLNRKEENQYNVHHHHQHNVITSSFSFPPDSGSSIFGPYHRASGGGISAGGGHGIVEIYYDNCVQVKAEGIRKCALLLTATHLILEFDDEHGGMFEGEIIALEETRRRSREEIEDEKERKSRINYEGGKHISTEDAYNPRSKENVERTERYHRDTAAQRPISLRWNISELSHIYLRRYRLRDTALELFFIPSAGSVTGGAGLFLGSTSLFLDFGPGYEGNTRRDGAANAMMKRAPVQTVKQWPEKSGQFLHEQLSRLTMGWVQGRVSNFDYLLHLNCLAGRSYNDLCQYPVMPWVLSNYTSETVPDLNDQNNFRDLTKPMGALNPARLEEFIERFETFQDPTIPPFMYGSHYSTSAGVVLHFLVRLHPYAALHRQLQSGHFDVADRLFSSVPRTWDICTGTSAAEVKELTPEWYCNPAFLKNSNNFNLGTSQEGEVLGDVVLPPWAEGSPEKFIEVMRCALESDICSEMLPHWIDLIFGRKQQGPESVTAHNVFFYLTYYGSVDVAAIEDEALRTATELQIAHFGQCPMQLFWRPHVHKHLRSSRRRRLTLTQMLDLYRLDAGEIAENANSEVCSQTVTATGELQDINREGETLTVDYDQTRQNALPFLGAPTSHRVHLGAPPPGPHAPMIAVRLAGIDRCLCVDSQGIFHSFRWAWKPEEIVTHDAGGEESNSTKDDKQAEADNLILPKEDIHMDKGCFIAQRELPHFKSIPRLPFAPQSASDRKTVVKNDEMVVVCISNTLFASRSLLLVLSDGDGMGALAMQLVDPAKGIVKGEVIIPSIHSARVSAIAMDPIGTAAGHGGVGGELAAVGAADGTMTLWRFISSHYWPLRPRLRMGGHGGHRIHSVAINSALNVCVSVSDKNCCIFDITNGAILRSFAPPNDIGLSTKSKIKASQIHTVFADSPALCVTVQGFVVLLCKTTYFETVGTVMSPVVTVSLQLFSLEGTHIGSKILEPRRRIPHRILATADGRGVMVCGGEGISIHQVSSVQPLKLIDEWRITEGGGAGIHPIAAYDIDFGPTLTKPVVAAAGCSQGALQLHALQGISSWSEENKKGSMSVAVGNALAKPAQAVKNAVGSVKGIGSRVVGFGKDIGREAMSDVKERGVFRRLFSGSS